MFVYFSEVTFSSSVRKKHKQPASESHLFEQSINENFLPAFSFVWLDVKICKYQIICFRHYELEECPDSPFICFLRRNGPSFPVSVVDGDKRKSLFDYFLYETFFMLYRWEKFINDVDLKLINFKTVKNC